MIISGLREGHRIIEIKYLLRGNRSMNRENFQSRLGFILVSAGCAIGIGNVWRFPYVAGQNGGGVFVLFYLIFLLCMGVPVLTMELAVGRAGKKSAVQAYKALEKDGQKWHIHGYFTLIGCYLLMMFYTTVAGWMLHYFYLTLTGKLSGLDSASIAGKFTEMLGDPATMTFWMIVVVAERSGKGRKDYDDRTARHHDHSCRQQLLHVRCKRRASVLSDS